LHRSKNNQSVFKDLAKEESPVLIALLFLINQNEKRFYYLTFFISIR